jgi:hypothetical protein
MSKAKHYEVRDLATDELLATGTAVHCAEVVGASKYAIVDIAHGKYKSRRFRIVEIAPPVEAPKPKQKKRSEFDGGMRAAANRWEEFCAPIRRKYGIPVHQPEKGK